LTHFAYPVGLCDNVLSPAPGFRGLFRLKTERNHKQLRNPPGKTGMGGQNPQFIGGEYTSKQKNAVALTLDTANLPGGGAAHFAFDPGTEALHFYTPTLKHQEAQALRKPTFKHR
jgi:hypothetical protein